MTDKVDAAIGKFMSGYNCAQAVVFAHCDELGLEKDAALKLACGFGGGMGGKQEVCGAVAGGLLVLGAMYGRGENDDRKVTEKTYARTRELLDRFKFKHGSYTCRDLLDGCDLMTKEGQDKFKQNDLLNKTCKECVRSVVQILGEMQTPAPSA
jgi:C_GCAxxG_C_C family probable redox protein